MGVNQVLLGAVKIMDISDSTVTADKMLSGATAYDKAGDKIEGSIQDNGSVSATFDGIDTKSASVPAGYTSGGTVALDGTIDAEVGTQADLIAQIQEALEGKAAGGGGGGSSGGGETVNLVLSRCVFPANGIYATSADGSMINIKSNGTYTVARNSLIGSNSGLVMMSGAPDGLVELDNDSRLFQITADTTWSFM